MARPPAQGEHGEVENDVAGFARVRWADLVRTLLALGSTTDEAELAARRALADCWTAWAGEHRSGDVDVLVYRALLHAWHWPERHPDVSSDDVAHTLIAGARLGEHQAEQVTGAPVDGPDSRTVPLWDGEQWDDSYRAPAPIEAIRDDVRRARRRRLRRWGAAAAVLVVLAGATVLVREVRRPDPPPTPPATNPVPLGWWSLDTLHLAGAEVEVGGLLSLAQAGAGTSYPLVLGDDRGRVVQVDPDGTLTQIGSSVVGAPVRAAPDGRAAWVDDGSSVVVWDTATKTVEGVLALDHRTGRRTEVVALDGDAVYLRSPAGTSRWDLGTPRAHPVPDRVLAVAAGVPLIAVAPRSPGASEISVGKSSYQVAAPRRATLSPDGRLVATWMPQTRDISLLRTDGRPTAMLGLPPDAHVVDARFAPGGELVVVTSRVYPLARDFDDGSTLSGRTPYADLVTCDTTSGSCEVVAGKIAFAGPTEVDLPIVLAD